MEGIIRSHLKIFIFLVLVILLVFVFIYPYILGRIGHFVALENAPKEADLIVILNGRDTERSLAAVDLYNKGYSKLIVISRGPKQPGSDEFWRRVGNNFDGKSFLQRALEAMGIPEDSLKFVGDGVTSTYDEALATRQFMKRNGYKSVLLVTSKWHSKRAYLTFKSVFKDDEMNIIICPSGYDTFDPDTWWKKNSDVELVFDEYVRLVYYLLSFRISPTDIFN